MEYGKMTNEQLIIHRAKQEGDKPIVRTAAPTFAYNESPYFYWEETEDGIVQHWGATIVPDMPEIEPTSDEILNIILGGDNT